MKTHMNDMKDEFEVVKSRECVLLFANITCPYPINIIGG